MLDTIRPVQLPDDQLAVEPNGQVANAELERRLETRDERTPLRNVVRREPDVPADLAQHVSVAVDQLRSQRSRTRIPARAAVGIQHDGPQARGVTGRRGRADGV